MTDTLPDPLTPPECDLRDFQFIPLDIVRLFGSEFHGQANDSEWRAGVTLWLKSFHQVPAASLPDDDRQLARAAELGTDVKKWKKLKEIALHGWVRANDGRLYHPVVAEKALEAWIEKLRQRKSSGAGNAKKYGHSFDPSGHEAAIETAAGMLAGLNPQSRLLRIRSPSGTPTGTPGRIPPGSQETGTGKGQGIVPLAKANGRSGAKPDPWKEVFDYGKALLGPSSGGVITNLRKHFRDKPHKVLAKLKDAAEQREPLAWINAFLWQHGDGDMEGIDTGALI